MIDIDELERLVKAATPGPWFVTCNCTGKTFYTIKIDRVYIGETLGVYNGEANAAYLVAACNAVPELIAETRALQERVQELERQRWHIASYLETVQMCEECPAYNDCPSTGMLGAGACVDEIIKWGERVVKEAGE